MVSTVKNSKIGFRELKIASLAERPAEKRDAATEEKAFVCKTRLHFSLCYPLAALGLQRW